MQAKRIVGVLVVGLLSVTLFVHNVAAVSLFSETFESYAAGSNLIGQGGWTGTNPILVGDVGVFSSRAADGRQNPGHSNVAFASHALSAPLDPSEITRMTFDALAVSVSPISHNSGVYFESAVANGFGWFVARTIPGWFFDARGLVGASGLLSVSGGYDTPVQFGLVVDGPANEIYGFYDFGAGMQFTPHFSVLPTQISNIDAVEMFMDYRGVLGAAFDNVQVSTIQVSAVPEPATFWMLGLGLLVTGALLRRKL